MEGAAWIFCKINGLWEKQRGRGLWLSCIGNSSCKAFLVACWNWEPLWYCYWFSPFRTATADGTPRSPISSSYCRQIVFLLSHFSFSREMCFPFFFLSSSARFIPDREIGFFLQCRKVILMTVVGRESRGIDRFCDYPRVYCVILSCARRKQSNGKCKFHQTCQCDAYV